MGLRLAPTLPQKAALAEQRETPVARQPRGSHWRLGTREVDRSRRGPSLPATRGAWDRREAKRGERSARARADFSAGEPSAQFLGKIVLARNTIGGSSPERHRRRRTAASYAQPRCSRGNHASARGRTTRGLRPLPCPDGRETQGAPVRNSSARRVPAASSHLPAADRRPRQPRGEGGSGLTCPAVRPIVLPISDARFAVGETL